ncbi:MAG: LysR family transcriptional regulator [Rhizobiaceae bacterium]|nr:LysR family transcriptional regulator [Rhizobiaceae bacterium]
MPRNLPLLSFLPAFEATARLGSVTRAANELGRVHGAISRQLQLLQEQLGVPLFEKVGTGLRLNEDGAVFFAAVSRAFDVLEECSDEFKARRGETSVHLACSATFAMVWLVPRLSEFYRLYPSCRVQLSMSSSGQDRGISRTQNGADFTLSWDRLSRPVVDRHYIPLAPVSFGLVASPDYPIKSNNNETNFAVRISHDHMKGHWENWQTATGQTISAPNEIAFPHVHLCVGAAVAGMGVALVERRFVMSELQSGKLVERSQFLTYPDGFVAMTNPSRQPSPAADRFLDWLKKAFKEE